MQYCQNNLLAPSGREQAGCPASPFILIVMFIHVSSMCDVLHTVGHVRRSFYKAIHFQAV
jgi:hypothetical protein